MAAVVIDGLQGPPVLIKHLFMKFYHCPVSKVQIKLQNRICHRHFDLQITKFDFASAILIF